MMERDLDPPEFDISRPRYIFHKRPRCPNPKCRSVRLRAYATRRPGKKGLSRYCRCAVCGQRVIMVLE